MNTLYIVLFKGTFGFIKPWTAVRDELTYSEKFLAPSTVQGISQKLFGIGNSYKIARYRLCFGAYSEQQEQTQAKAPEKSGSPKRKSGILTRGVLLEPELYLAFANEQDAHIAAEQHICMCRNEDLLLPTKISEHLPLVVHMAEEEFNQLDGYELIATSANEGMPVGRNRFLEGHPLEYGRLTTTGIPIRYALPH